MCSVDWNRSGLKINSYRSDKYHLNAVYLNLATNGWTKMITKVIQNQVIRIKPFDANNVYLVLWSMIEMRYNQVKNNKTMLQRYDHDVIIG